MAGKKKGLSLEEKKQKMLELFYEKKEFFQLKELEKVAPKEKGIVSQSVKEVVQLVVDEDLVDSDKIGTILCYWAFPSKALVSRQSKLSAIQSQLAELDEKKAYIDSRLGDARLGKEDTEARRNLIAEVELLEKQSRSLKGELDSYKEFDPETLSALARDAGTAKLAANRWTDNVFAVKQWCRTKFQMEESVLDKHFEIPEDLDYIQ